MKKKIVYVLLDAFRTDYIDSINTPFLKECSEKGMHYKEVVPSLSFCERTEIFTGLEPIESDMFTAIGFIPERSPYKNVGLPLDVLDFFERIFFSKNKLLSKLFRKVLSRLFKKLKFKLSCYHIPLKALKYFALTEDQFSFFDNRAFHGKESLFLLCEQQNKKIFYDSFTALNFHLRGTDADRLNLALENANADYDLFLVYVAAPDSFGHFLGPDTPEMKVELNKLDKRLSTFHSDFLARYPNASFIFGGDHGMRTVEHKFNIKQIVDEITSSLNLKFGLDFLYFVDSTMFRMWWLRTVDKEKVKEELKKSKLSDFGRFVSEEEEVATIIPRADRKYGDLLWVANKGVLLSPDFFHNEISPKGMHGYFAGEKEEHGTCIVVGENIEPGKVDKIKLTHMYEILKEQLKLN